MKNLLLSALMLFSISVQSQDFGEKLKGVWSSEETSYYVVILHDKQKYEFTNFSFEENNVLQETFVEEGKDYVKTKIHNPKNNWEVFITYKYVNKNTLTAKFEGSINQTSFYKRHWVMTN